MIFSKKLSKRKILWGLFALLFAGAMMSCVVDDKDDDKDDDTPAIDNPVQTTPEISSVTVSGATAIEAKGSGSLTATPTFTEASADSSSVTYKWEITGGANYASLSATEGASVSITGNNTEQTAQTVTVNVTATYGGKSVSATYSVTIAAVGVSIPDALTELTITAAANSVSATGTVNLTATATYTGNPSISFAWEITDGSDFASLESTTGRAAQTVTKSNTLTGKNTTETEQSVTVKVTASDGKNEKTATYTVTVGAKFVVPTVTKITVYSGISSSSKKGEYDTVAAALADCGSSGDFRIVLPAGTYAENGLVYNGSGTIRITGSGSAKHGTDVVIKGHGSTMPVDGGSSAQNARELLLFKGTGNLILENLTLESDWLRSEHSGVSAMQAEVLGFNASGYVAAYNCSFISHQDTVRTVGKGWFYDCHIEGDVDFIWMEAGGKVALYENCEIVSVYDSAASNHATYIAAPKINLGNTAGKGVVVFNSSITAPANQKTYLFRNPWSSTPDNQYNQAAFVNCTIDGNLEPALSSSDANGTADQQYIGWKVDADIASKYTSKASKIGTLSADTEEKEYSGRRAILNRNYMVDSARFEKDTASNWDIDGFIAEVGWSVDTDDSKDYYDGETITKVYSWDMVTNNKPSAGYLASTQDSSVKLYISQAGGSGGCPCYHPGTGSKVYIPASVGDKVEVVTHSGNYYGFTLGGTAATSNAETLTVTETVSSGQSGDTNTYVLLEVTGDCYIHSITVTGTGSSSGGSGESGGSESGETTYTLTFSGSNEVDEADYFTASGITSGKLKVNSTGNIVFTTSYAATVTVTSVYSNTTSGSTSQWGIFKDTATTATVSGPVHNNTGTADNTEYEETVELSEAGTYKIARANGNSKEFFIYKVVVTEKGGSSSGGSGSGGTGGSGGSESGGSGSGESGGETGSNVISKNDTPTGFANIDVSKMTKIVTVSSKADFKKYVEAGGYIVYVSGTIDLSEGMLPTEAGGSTSALDAFVKSTDSTFTSYADFVEKYAGACTSSTDDKSSSSPSSKYGKNMWALNSAYGTKVVVKPKSNTMIIGLGSDAVIKGGSLNISGVSNVALRNLTIQDAYDPFPHHEKNDGFNAQLDCIVVQGTTSNIWIDHCTLKDTMKYKTVAISGGSEKWQTYDGLCDIKGSASSVVVSYCKITAHDKTMLIGSSDTESFTGTRQVTLHHNYFFNCGQRLPFVRMTNVHVYNNYYHYDSSVKLDDGSDNYSQSAAIQVRSEAKIFAENNNFSSGMQYAYKGDSATSSVNGVNKVADTQIYESGNVINAKNKDSSSSYFTYVNSAPFTPSYTYTADPAANLPTLIPENAGAGVLSVVQ
ncbi:hypothetical protein [uncultured Treponema sp.]|uniref:pectate lyase family protein n=1 Tax=uncultured Treponema sp. TaxID=162155 RepID=UPI0015BF9A7C|nr:hypothetical protein [uncultured Treponema sp.]